MGTEMLEKSQLWRRICGGRTLGPCHGPHAERFGIKKMEKHHDSLQAEILIHYQISSADVDTLVTLRAELVGIMCR